MDNWPATYDETYDFHALANLRAFERAIFELSEALSPLNIPFASALSLGDDVQLASLYAGWQNTVESLLAGFVPADFDPGAHDPADPLPYLTLADCLAAAGYSGTTWRRDCRRIVADSAAAVDAEGNVAAVGQRAFSTLDGVILEHDGSSWAITPPLGTLADYLSSETAAPNTAVAGPMRIDDFIGWWVFAQLHDVINQLTTAPGAAPVQVNGYTRDVSGTGQVTWASATSSTDIDFAGTGTTPAATGFLSYSVGTDDTNTYFEDIILHGGQLETTATTLIPKTVEIWVGVQAPSGTFDVSVFDGTGYAGLTDSAWWQVSMTAAGDTNATVDSAEWPDHTIQPTPADDPTPTPIPGTPTWAYVTARGFELVGTLAIERFAFTYHA